MARLRETDAAARRDSDQSKDFLEALARGLSVMTVFDAEHRQMTMADVARAVDLPRATVRRTLYTLTCLGYVETNGKLYRLTPRILRLAAAYLGSSQVGTVLQPVCDELCRTLDEACSAAVLDGRDTVMVAHASPPRSLAVAPSIGFRLPAYCTALGRVLLANLKDGALSDYLTEVEPRSVTPSTITEPEALRAAILQVREQGFSLVDQEAEMGFRSIAVPIRRHDGSVVAALNIGSRIERASPDDMRDRFLPALASAAKAVQDQLI